MVLDMTMATAVEAGCVDTSALAVVVLGCTGAAVEDAAGWSAAVVVPAAVVSPGTGKAKERDDCSSVVLGAAEEAPSSPGVEAGVVTVRLSGAATEVETGLVGYRDDAFWEPDVSCGGTERVLNMGDWIAGDEVVVGGIWGSTVESTGVVDGLWLSVCVATGALVVESSRVMKMGLGVGPSCSRFAVTEAARSLRSCKRCT